MRCGMAPTGTCVRVVLGMVQADRYRVSDLMRHDGRRRTLVGRDEVRAASVGGLFHVLPTVGCRFLGLSDMAFVLDDVCSWGRSGNYLLFPSISHFDPLRTYRNQNRPKWPRREALRLNYGSPFVTVKGLNPRSARAAHEAAPRCGNRK